MPVSNDQLTAPSVALKIRPAGVAGSFYPADPQVLAGMVDDLLAQAVLPSLPDPILAVIAPHAGYIYSGPVAAYSYAALRGHDFTRVVVVAPSHREGFDFTSVYNGDAYATPLGTIRVDKEFAKRLSDMSPTMRLSGQGHDATPAGAEHAIEVQLPFLQRVLGEFQLVPIVMGSQSYESCRALGEALARLIQAEGTLLVASSDLSHFHPYEDAVTLDRKTLDALESWDTFAMARNFPQRVWEACGGAPIVATMMAAERMGASQTVLLDYANSGDTVGDHASVVGYSASLLVKARGERDTKKPFSLSDAEKQELLALARASAEYAVLKNEAFTPAPSTSLALNREYGAFVTLRIASALRGCIGFTSAVKPLYITVRDTATLAALRDPRFQPVSPAELPQLQYEISVLSPLRRTMDVAEIEVGRHGLLIKNGTHEGLLLPQVPVEQRWDRQTFLNATCVKAGLPPDAWKDENTDIFLFTAVVFEESRMQELIEDSATPALFVR
jgi:AmmeMemoRadiSam system protein B/AmmeMemoRadiSam system protein A